MQDEKADRRTFLGYLAGLGLASVAAPSLADATLSVDDLGVAAKLAGLELTEAERQLMLKGLNEQIADWQMLRTAVLDPRVAPPLVFDPWFFEDPPPADAAPRADVPTGKAGGKIGTARPVDDLDLLYLSIREQGALLRAGVLSSVELTRISLDRLKKVDERLCAVVNLTEDRALAAAERADDELANGHDRGPLHGIPWGAKDLLAARGYKTTWGDPPFRDQSFAEDAAVVARLEAAGAVLIAKLSLGALAWGDVWFGGRTANPWKLEQGSSGSSAGSASTVVAAGASFTIGSETLGSIVSPSTRCGATGLRPTFGRVSRFGAMPLAWSFDKLGPICRSVDDCALVFEAICGPDRRDPATRQAGSFSYDWRFDPFTLKVGFAAAAFEEERPDKEWQAFDKAVLANLEKIGFKLIPIELPTMGKEALPIDPCSSMIGVEAAAVFDELTRSNRDDLLTRQGEVSWPNRFREARLYPAVEYVQMARLRTIAMERMSALMKTVDVYVCPSFGGRNLLLTNLTGHPSLTMPNGFRADGTPTSITFTGRLNGEQALLAVGLAFQRSTDFHRRRPAIL